MSIPPSARYRGGPLMVSFWVAEIVVCHLRAIEVPVQRPIDWQALGH